VAKPANKMGLWMSTALVSGNMIGSGVFLLPASLAKIGSISIVSWVLTSLGAFALAIIFSGMSILVPRAGGPYVYVRKGFGDFLGFQTAYSYWINTWVGNAAIALAAASYARSFIPILHHQFLTALTAISLVWIFTLINSRGARTAGYVQLIATICKITPLLLIGILGWFYFNPDYITQSVNLTGHSDFSAITSAAALTLWAFTGVESATVGADAMRNPKRDVPLATLMGTVIAAIVYITSSVAIMGMVPAPELAASTSPFALAAEKMFGQAGHYLIAVGAVISCIGALNGWIMLQGQVAMDAAEDKLFPRFFAKRNKHDVPVQGMIFTSILVTGLLLLTSSPDLIKQFDFIILLAVIASLVPYLYTAMAAFIIVKENPLSKRQRMLYGIAAILASIYAFWAISGAGKDVIYYGFLLLLFSLPLYIWVCRSHTKAA